MVPLPCNASARCFDCASLAQHDRKQKCCGKKQLLLLFSVEATIGRPPFYLPQHSVVIMPLFQHQPPWWHSKRSRGISWKRILSNPPRQSFYCCLGFLPRGLGYTLTKQRFREMFRQAQHDKMRSLTTRKYNKSAPQARSR